MRSFSLALASLLMLLPLALAGGSQYSQCKSLLEGEQAFCKSYLNGKKPEPKTTTVTWYQTVYPKPVWTTVTDYKTDTVTKTHTKTKTDDVTVTDTIKKKTTVTSTCTKTATVTKTWGEPTTTCRPYGINNHPNRRSEADVDVEARGGKPSNWESQVWGFPSDIITEACYEILYGWSSPPEKTVTVDKTITEPGKTDTKTVYDTKTITDKTKVYVTKTWTITDYTTKYWTKTDDVTTTTTVTKTVPGQKPVQTVWGGCPSSCKVEMDMGGNHWCDNYNYPSGCKSCKQNSDCGSGGEMCMSHSGGGLCMPPSAMCSVAPLAPAPIGRNALDRRVPPQGRAVY